MFGKKPEKLPDAKREYYRPVTKEQFNKAIETLEDALKCGQLSIRPKYHGGPSTLVLSYAEQYNPWPNQSTPPALEQNQKTYYGVYELRDIKFLSHEELQEIKIEKDLKRLEELKKSIKNKSKELEILLKKVEG